MKLKLGFGRHTQTVLSIDALNVVIAADVSDLVPTASGRDEDRLRRAQTRVAKRARYRVRRPPLIILRERALIAAQPKQSRL